MCTSGYSSAIAHTGVCLRHLRGTSLPPSPEGPDSLAGLGIMLLTHSDSTGSPLLAAVHWSPPMGLWQLQGMHCSASLKASARAGKQEQREQSCIKGVGLTWRLTHCCECHQLGQGVSAGHWTYSGPADGPHGCHSDECEESPLLSSLLFLPRQYQFNVNCNADCEPEHSEARSCQNHCLCILLCIPQRPFPVWCHRQRAHS